MDEIEKLKLQMKWLVILVSAYIIFSTVFTILLINGIDNREKVNEDSIYKIELAHMMQINEINQSTITQFSDSNLNTICRFSYMDFRFADRCIKEMIEFKNEITLGDK